MLTRRVICEHGGSLVHNVGGCHGRLVGGDDHGLRCSGIEVERQRAALIAVNLRRRFSPMSDTRKPCMRFRPFIGGDLETLVRCDLIVRVRFLAAFMLGGLVKSTTANQEQ